MKQFIAISRNIYYKGGDEKEPLIPYAELVLIFAEPKYTGRNVDGSLMRTDEMSEIRFRVEHDDLVKISGWLLDYADDMDKALERVENNVYSTMAYNTVMTSKKKEPECDKNEQ